MLEPLFATGNFAYIKGTPKIYDQVSEGSGKIVHIHFCETCGTKLNLSFERFEGLVGVYSGTFDDPNWFDVGAENAKQIYLSSAQKTAVALPGIVSYEEHSTKPDGSPQPATTYEHCMIIGSRSHG